jgi:hypothetical protein
MWAKSHMGQQSAVAAVFCCPVTRQGVGFLRRLGYRSNVMRLWSESLTLLAASLAGIGLLCAVPAAATQAKSRLQPKVTGESLAPGFRSSSQALPLQPMNLDVTRFAFTAPGRMTTSRVQAVEREFSFTPSRGKKGVSVGATVRSVTPASIGERTASAESGLAPAGYNFDLAVGYRGVSLSGGVTRVDSGLGGVSRKGLDVGVGYGTRNWQAAIEATAERDASSGIPRIGSPDPRYSVEARGALALAPNVSLGGSVRYRPALQNPTPLDPNKDDRAVMLGGAVAF